MQNRFLPKFIITATITLCVFCFVGSFCPLFAQNEPVKPAAQENPNSLQEQARQYREAGLENQRMGNLPAAMSLYQKAIAIDPAYSVAYNDLGVIYEAANFPGRAEESYLKSIKIDPDYPSVYTNLALLYESQRDLEKAAYYWAKRSVLGSVDDPWTQRAISRLKDIRLVLSNRPIADQREEDVLGLMKDAAAYKSVFNKADEVQAQNHLRKASQYYKKRKLTAAIKEAFQAQDLDKANPKIKEFIEKIDSDPGSAAAYNDLGVIYEAAGFPDRAEESYLKSIRVDPALLSAYVNIALFYEKQRDLKKAEFYWAKRAELGSPDDPWKQKAVNRAKDIRLVLSNRPIADQREEDVLGLTKDVSAHKTVLNKDDKALAQAHFLKAKQSYNKGDLATAIKEALDAQYLNQNNPEIEAFIEKAELRALSR